MTITETCCNRFPEVEFQSLASDEDDDSSDDSSDGTSDENHPSDDEWGWIYEA